MAILFESLKICEYLESLLKDTFGPCGLDVMLNSSSGKVLITNSGGVILNSLSLGHPVASVVVDKMKAHNDITGDGCSSFIIVLTQALREITKLLEVNSPSELKTPSLQTMLALSKHFMQIQNELDILVQPTLDKISVNIDLLSDDKNTIKETLKHIINTCLNGKFTNSVQKLLASLLLELMTNSFSLGDCLYEDIISLIDDFPQWCIEFHGLPVHSSYIDQGFMLPRGLSTAQDVTLPKPGKTFFTFVILQCSLDCSRSEGSAVIEVNNLPTYSKTLLHNQSITFSVLKSFKEQDVELIISSDSVSDMALHLCRQLGIAVIQMVPLETINYICKHENLQSICSVNQYDIQNISNQFKGKGLCCKEKVIGGHKHVQLCTPQEASSIYHIILCAPSQGLFQQYCIALQGVLKCIKMSISKSRKALTLLPGCGSTEFVISQIFGQLAHSTPHGQMATTFDVLSKSFLQIPRMLHMNSHQSCDKNYVRIQQRMKASWKDGNLLGIDGRMGDVVDPYSRHIYEPYQGKVLWISHLLQCLAMILRIDKIVGVKCPKDKNG